jgi:hypothetical protein
VRSRGNTRSRHLRRHRCPTMAHCALGAKRSTEFGSVPSRSGYRQGWIGRLNCWDTFAIKSCSACLSGNRLYEYTVSSGEVEVLESLQFALLPPKRALSWKPTGLTLLQHVENRSNCPSHNSNADLLAGLPGRSSNKALENRGLHKMMRRLQEQRERESSASFVDATDMCSLV